jgi:hypothetical protein
LFAVSFLLFGARCRVFCCRNADTVGQQVVAINGINFGAALGPGDTVFYRVSISQYANTTLPVADVGGPNGTLVFYPANCTMVVPHTKIRTCLPARHSPFAPPPLVLDVDPMHCCYDPVVLPLPRPLWSQSA